MNGFAPQENYDIVVVDDNALTLELLKRVLRNTSCNVGYFADELCALSYLESHKTRVLIVDHRMPRLDGLELLQRLVDGGGIGAERVYLCSAEIPPESVCESARKCGAETLSKDIFRNKDEFLRLLSEPSQASAVS